MEESGSGGNESNNEPQGTVFGVDGVSKTGSTSQDQQIGYTDGQGGKGSNYDALQGATSQQTSAAVAAANAAKASGGNETAQQAAVSNVLESYDPGFVNRSGNLTDSGQSAINRAAQEAIEDTAEFERIQGIAPASAALANIDVTQPPAAFASAGITPAEAARFDAMGVVTRDLAPLRAELASLPTNILSRRLGPSLYEGETITQTPERSAALSELTQRAAAGDVEAQNVIEAQRNAIEPGITPAEFARIDAANNLSQALSGIQTLAPSVSADAILATQPLIGRSMGGANELFGGTGTTAPASAPVTDAGLYGGYEDDPAYDADIFGVPRYAGGKTGLDGQMQGFSDARQMGDFVSSATEGNFLTDIMSFLPGLDPVEANRNNVRDMMEAGAQFNQESGKLELDTGRGTLRMSDSGVVTYSGMPNPDYTGPFGNLVNPPAQTGDDEAMTTNVAKSPQDPCPPGYTLVNGVCQPVDDVTTAPPGSGFQFFPSGGFPTSFQPVTQATQVGQVNPFVLRPNVPQGIQGLSPTGAALGRQV